MKKMIKNKRILIVEDEKAVATILNRKLSKEGFDIILATDGKEGLKKALSEKPDLILLDIVLPIMDGLTMLKKLRQNSKGKNIPVIILTNLTTDPERLTNAGKYGTADYLVKANWSINDLTQKVMDTFSK